MENIFLLARPDSKKQRIINYFKRTWKIEWIIIFGAIFLDVFTKFLIERLIDYRTGMVTIIPNFLELVHFRNYAAAVGFDFFNFFGMFGPYPTATQARTFFIVFISITISAFIFYMVWGNRNRKLFRIALALIVGGALGNLYCRIFHGAVRDWIQFRFLGMTIFGWRTFPVFNFADAFLIIGVVVFMVYFFKDWSKDEKDKEAAKAQKKKALEGAADEDIATDEAIIDNNEAMDNDIIKEQTNAIEQAPSEVTTTHEQQPNDNS